ncbi:MAG: hypothetical protein UT18_C0033G0003 [candidate division CPR2 bacterium GW2011_GWC2_39_10]|uniref:Uncharacterized protein n=1 Tax=candidate division CPR2 bacterium GW2011_GWC2_39_10 TaxID=1618345 RepID=A0A0G0LXY8_UNCC2|nr:MAG: hypothetical protein UT18_C0033G0003 [candidate division CPR2 bacterium GW2011_GWC2_39_10]
MVSWSLSPIPAKNMVKPPEKIISGFFYTGLTQNSASIQAETK